MLTTEQRQKGRTRSLKIRRYIAANRALSVRGHFDNLGIGMAALGRMHHCHVATIKRDLQRTETGEQIQTLRAIVATPLTFNEKVDVELHRLRNEIKTADLSKS